MSNWVDLKSLYSTLAREIENDSLQYAQHGIYRDMAGMIGNLKGQGYDGVEAKIKNVLAQLLSDMVTLLINTRLDKIRNSKLDYSNLTEEEQYIVMSEKDFRIRIEQVLSTTLAGRVKVLESIALKGKTAHVLLRFLRPMEVISGVDNTRYGPFEEEDVAVLPFENAKHLISAGIAVEIPLLDE